MNDQRRKLLTQSLVDTLQVYNEAYRAGRPLVSDGHFDALEEQLRLLDPTNPFLSVIVDDTEVTVAGPAEATTVDLDALSAATLALIPPAMVDAFLTQAPHTIVMGSQQKAMSLADSAMHTWLTDAAGLELSWSDKLDGASAELTYRDGQFVRALTRGDGTTGVDITAAVWCIPTVPKTLPEPYNLVVRGEIVVRRSVFPKLNAALIAAGRKPVANVRNGAVGVMKTLANIAFAKYLDFFAFNTANLAVPLQDSSHG